MKKLNKDELYHKYIVEEKTPYVIAKELNVNHKTVRSYLKKYNIPMRTASEYNFLARKNYVSPSKKELHSKRSIAAHIAYICEGWHTEKSTCVNFTNQDPQLIDLIIWCLEEVYQVKTLSIKVCGPDEKSCENFLELYPSSYFVKDVSRKKPIIKVISGGKMLVRDLVQNAYSLLNLLS